MGICLLQEPLLVTSGYIKLLVVRHFLPLMGILMEYGLSSLALMEEHLPVVVMIRLYAYGISALVIASRHYKITRIA
jgi:hypothetical protein